MSPDDGYWERGQELYLDGEEVTSDYTDKPSDVLHPRDIQVGGPYLAENEALTAIDELCIYKRSLSVAER